MKENKTMWLWLRAREHRMLAGAVLLCLLAGACVTLTRVAPKEDRGLRFSHAQHAEEGIDCADCHDFSDDGAVMPFHDVCGMCHELDPKTSRPEDCDVCHTNAERIVPPRNNRLSEEVVFGHAPHLDKEIECGVCHSDPEKGALLQKALKPFCMDCHEKTDSAPLACEVCHTRISKGVRPTHRGPSRIAHDAPGIWEHLHGREARLDQQYCGLCHDMDSFCSDCHRKNPPKSHTLAWRRKPHGLRASWDRGKCAVCHEEETCRKCHESTSPRSHRSNWGEPINRHCATCHYPPSQAGCTVCHEAIEHPSAMRSPHRLRVFNTPCAVCHPGGRPHRAPHPHNSTVHCTACH